MSKQNAQMNRWIKRSDMLWKVIHSCLARYICAKISDPSKYNHTSLFCVQINLNRFVVILYYFNQARHSQVINCNICLLKTLSSGWFVLANDESFEGLYLYFCIKDVRLTRSGNTVGSDASNPVNGLVLRNEKGHKKKTVSASLIDGEYFFTLNLVTI